VPFDDEGTRALVARAAELSARLTAEGVPVDAHRARMLEELGAEGLLRVLVAAAPDDEARRAALQALAGAACGRCGGARGAADRYCAACGAPLEARAATADEGR
jgi:hypothetical protein